MSSDVDRAYKDGYDTGRMHASQRVLLNDDEQAVMDHILAAMNGIQALGLRANSSELAQAVHVLQSYVIQHMLQRLEPDHWGNWFEREAA